MPSKWVEVWPEMQVGIRQSLQQRGVDADTIDDIVQEVALRLSSAEHHFRSVEHAVAWGRLVAVRLHVTAVRREQRLEHDLVEVAASDDVDRTVELRMAVEAVSRAWPKLRPVEQAAILDGRGQPVRRHRARARLAAMVGSVWRILVGLARSRRVAVPVLLAASLLPLAVAVDHHLDATPAEAPPVTDAGIRHSPVAAHPPPALPDVDRPPMPTRVRVPATSLPGAPPRHHSTSQVEVSVAEPSGTHGGSLGGDVRPKEPDDHFVCADTIVAGRPCYDPPSLPWP